MTERVMPSRWRLALGHPVPADWLVALRVMLGALLALSAGRTIANGWVERFFIRPEFFFSYTGFAWLPRPDAALTPWLFWALLVSGLCVSAGLFTRASLLVATLLFTYMELLDVTNYLNHYYLVSLLCFLLLLTPAHAHGSLDARRAPHLASRSPCLLWHVLLLRFQIASVYFWAGMAKLHTDWLLHAQPLRIWLNSRQETPLVGELLARIPQLPLFMSWAGFLFDTTIWIFLLWRKTRPAAFVALCIFHGCTALLFDIGLFPLIMTCAATCFFSPSWPRRLPGWARLEPAPRDVPTPRHVSSLTLGLLGVYCLFQIVMPLRHLVTPGDVLWHERGMRWSWKVMVREKNGAITYRVTLPGERRERIVPPSRYLTPHQEREMSGQPDLILRLAHHIGEEFVREGASPPQVRVDALVSLNGRPPAPLIDPTIDLMTVEDTIFGAAPWILPAPRDPPPSLTPR